MSTFYGNYGFIDYFKNKYTKIKNSNKTENHELTVQIYDKSVDFNLTLNKVNYNYFGDYKMSTLCNHGAHEHSVKIALQYMLSHDNYEFITIRKDSIVIRFKYMYLGAANYFMVNLYNIGKI
jgi:hypothetical protein